MSEILNVEWFSVCLNFKLTGVVGLKRPGSFCGPHPSYPSPGQSLSKEVLSALSVGDSSVGSHKELLTPRLPSPGETQLAGLLGVGLTSSTLYLYRGLQQGLECGYLCCDPPPHGCLGLK